MTKALIHKINKVDNYRIFQNWKPDGGVEFARVNLIYGQNGSGKSTLANLLAGCAANACSESESRDGNNDEASSGLQLLATQGAGLSSFPIDLDDREFWGRVRVFNKDFVRKNLRFEEANGPQPAALLTIGERLADAEEQLRILHPQRDEVKNSIHALEKRVTSSENAIGKRMTAVAKQIVDDLRSSPISRYRATNIYSKRQVRELLENNPSSLTDASTDLAADRERATGQAMNSVNLPPRGILMEQDALNEVRQLLATSVLGNTPISELVGHPGRSMWVQEGISLHQDLEECLFCGQELPADRLKALNAHFDESFKKIQADIDSFINRLRRSEATSRSYLDSFPGRSDVYEDLQEELQNSHTIYESEHNTYAATIQSIVLALKEKRENPFSTPKLSSNLTLTAPAIDSIKSVVDKHQEKINLHDTEAAKAAQRVEYFHIANFLDEYVNLKKDLEALKEEQNSQKTDLEDLDREIAILESVDGDPAPGANELTNGLCGLLGRNELTFSTQDSKHYVIKRAGAPATHLSEGEQTAIALLYFLSSVRENKIAGDPPIVVIDDPVSSLDHGILFGASAHIWSELVVNTYASQVFLLTHNFEFFRQWLIQMEAVPKSRREGGYKAYRVCAHVDGHGCRKPKLEVWKLDDDRRKRLRSQYHFFFDQVATCLKEYDKDFDLIAQMEAAALVPNTARKLLEGFLSFRTPANMGKLHNSVRAALDAHPGLDDSVRTMVVRYAHANSHLEEADPTKPLEPSESVPFLHALFTFMDHVDSEHFTSMCQALGHDPEVLLGTSFSTAEEVPA
ncbi:hypothetical protein BKH23_02495 [Actinomyces oris]|uniref:AAA family ATPase n=1 Tax=Actinomyces TaxID=1654 RepID=UPI00094D36A2|nr:MULTISPECIES: AAA family ATPase [Actinomyces]OLO63825.1 hypothetical protein BKH23_02495 [Actinomyces oris]